MVAMKKIDRKTAKIHTDFLPLYMNYMSSLHLHRSRRNESVDLNQRSTSNSNEQSLSRVNELMKIGKAYKARREARELSKSVDLVSQCSFHPKINPVISFMQ